MDLQSAPLCRCKGDFRVHHAQGGGSTGSASSWELFIHKDSKGRNSQASEDRSRHM